MMEPKNTPGWHRRGRNQITTSGRAAGPALEQCTRRDTMFTQNEYAAIQVNRDAYDQAFAEVENLRKLRAAGLASSSFVGRAARFSISRLGRALVAVGQRMARVEQQADPAWNA
jgi:hypothetical protein